MKNIDTKQLDAAVENIADSLKNILNDAITNNDVRMQSLVSINFQSENEQSIYGKGLVWTAENRARQFIYRGNPDRLYSTESIDIDEEQSYMIGNVPVLSATELGKTIRESNLVKVGVLQNLRTQGNLNLDETIFYNSDSQSIGIGTESPKGIINIVSYDSDFVIDSDEEATKLGNYSYSKLNIVTDNSPRITINANGKTIIHNNTTVNAKLGVNVNNVPEDVDFATSGPISFQQTKFSTGTEEPSTGNYKKGDIVWNTDPKPTGYVGWICILSGTPGDWRPFGQIKS